MTIAQKMRAGLKDAMKARDAVRLGFLRYWIAQLTLGTGAELDDAAALKKMAGVLKEAKTGTTTFTAEEIALLEEWVPKALDVAAIRKLLAPAADQIKAAPKDGMAMGVAMKALAGQQVDGGDVRAVVAELRQPSA